MCVNDGERARKSEKERERAEDMIKVRMLYSSIHTYKRPIVNKRLDTLHRIHILSRNTFRESRNQLQQRYDCLTLNLVWRARHLFYMIINT